MTPADGFAAAGGDGLDVDFANPTVRRILSGALKGLCGQAAHKLSMLDIAEIAGVSRATLYRYFQTKTDVIRAANELVSITFEDGVKGVGAAETAPVKVLESVLRYQFASNSENYSRMLEVEPSLVIQFFNDHFERHKAAMKTALEPVFGHLEDALGMAIDRDLVAELLIRTEISTLLVRAGPEWDRLPDIVPRLVEALVALARPGQEAGR